LLPLIASDSHWFSGHDPGRSSLSSTRRGNTSPTASSTPAADFRTARTSPPPTEGSMSPTCRGSSAVSSSS